MPKLILFPTEGERSAVESVIQFDPAKWKAETIGFGVVAAGIHSCQAIASQQPSMVVVAGIAGLFDAHRNDRFDLGSATRFDSVAIDGIGVGQGDDFVDAVQLGWHWIAGAASSDPSSGTIPCHGAGDGASAMLLTVCSASADPQDALRRSRRFPDAVGEDMEGFSVAYACARARIPLTIIRGFSNLVGQRDKSKWQIGTALASVANQLQQVIDEQTE